MVTIKEMCVVEKIAKAGYMGYVQSIPPKILGWILDNTICKNDHNMPALNIGPTLIATAMPIIAGYDVDRISTEKHEIPILIPSLAVKQDDGTWNLYTNVAIIFEVKYDKDDNDFITQTFNMKMVSESNDIKTSLSFFDLFSAFDA